MTAEIDDENGMSPVTEEVPVEFDASGKSVGVELETFALEVIKDPFDPEKIDVVTRNPTVDLLLARIRRGVLDLQPDFQRFAGIWTPRAQSRLIESMLLRIPLPSFYAAEEQDDRWVIVDGVQRLTAIGKFVDPESIDTAPLVLKGLEYLKDFDGKSFKDLPGRLQTRLLETEVVLHLIRRGTPEQVMFNIFARINTGGRPLTSQELRHALIPGRARELLRDLAESNAFQEATQRSVSPERMDDREMALRFIAFWLTEPEQYGRADFDQFLREAMHRINRLDESQVAELQQDFIRAMTAASEIFGEYAFRKRYPGQRRRNPVNKALFETISVNLARQSDHELRQLVKHRDRVQQRFSHLLSQSPEFVEAISFGTGDITKVRRRFAEVDKILKE